MGRSRFIVTAMLEAGEREARHQPRGVLARSAVEHRPFQILKISSGYAGAGGQLGPANSCCGGATAALILAGQQITRSSRSYHDVRPGRVPGSPMPFRRVAANQSGHATGRRNCTVVVRTGVAIPSMYDRRAVAGRTRPTEFNSAAGTVTATPMPAVGFGRRVSQRSAG